MAGALRGRLYSSMNPENMGLKVLLHLHRFDGIKAFWGIMAFNIGRNCLVARFVRSTSTIYIIRDIASSVPSELSLRLRRSS